MIGVCAALSLACAWRTGLRGASFHAAATQLRSARPTAVNLMHAVDRMLLTEQRGGDVAAVAEAIFREDVDLCSRIARHGAALISPGERILTICNTGGLATAGVGTAAGVIRRRMTAESLSRARDPPTAPGRTTNPWEFQRVGVPVALHGRHGRVGDVHRQGRPRSRRGGSHRHERGLRKQDRNAPTRHPRASPRPTLPRGGSVDDGRSGSDQRRGHPHLARDPAEVRGVAGRVRWAPADVPALSPAFDITPFGLVTSLITDRGVFRRGDLADGALR